ncbi:hypothetical protein AU255_15530 [Methyloprofundus sedimenti]|uniref:Uncharacterized protein n=1 Tax=Methyloprofundus sedimenti TaxID=1420851 RepID=A0A1V8M2I2_9GAMM|nr:hypothetical protein AU255_15530 [Methyloprofundus sedimenti]
MISTCIKKNCQVRLVYQAHYNINEIKDNCAGMSKFVYFASVTVAKSQKQQMFRSCNRAIW